MLKMLQSIGIVCLMMSVGQTASAYGAEPVATIKQDRPDSLQIADACGPSLSPRMAAAFGLPIRNPVQACSRS